MRIESFELTRKLIHLGYGSLALLLLYLVYHTYGILIVQIIATLLMLLVVLVDYLRIYHAIQLPSYLMSIRPHEKKKFCSATYGALSYTLCLLLFPLSLVMNAIALAIYSDTAAALVGKYFGSKDKSFIGSFAFFIVSLLCGFVFLKGILYIVLVSLFATFVERYTGIIDDNFSIPFFTALFAYLLAFIL